MQPMSDGMELNQEVLAQTLQNKLSLAAVREAQLESGVQQLMMENQQLKQRIIELEGQLEPVEGETQEG